MPRPKNPVPIYRLHKQSGQAIVTISANGSRKDMLLGRYNSPESKDEYRRILTDLDAGRIVFSAPTDITVNELCLRYWRHAEEYYRDAEGEPTSELTDLKYAIRVFREDAGHTPAREFGPLAFKRLRERMVGKGWARPTVNKHCGRVKRVVRWGVENELLPADRWEALRAVKGLSAGRTSAPEPEPIEPVDEAHYQAALPFVRPQVRALLELLTLTGMRPGEACRIRPCEIDTTAAVWVYRPKQHKGRWRGKSRAVSLGSRAQKLLAAFAPERPDGYYFSPQRAEAERLVEAGANRKTPRYPSHMKRNAAKRKANPKRKPGRHYAVHGLEVAVKRACKKAGVPSWHPNQLRHVYATMVRRVYGLEAAQVLLGHARADVTQVYAEKNLALAAKVAGEIG